MERELSIDQISCETTDVEVDFRPKFCEPDSFPTEPQQLIIRLPDYTTALAVLEEVDGVNLREAQKDWYAIFDLPDYNLEQWCSQSILDVIDYIQVAQNLVSILMKYHKIGKCVHVSKD